jgi:hypothetical protein
LDNPTGGSARASRRGDGVGRGGTHRYFTQWFLPTQANFDKVKLEILGPTESGISPLRRGIGRRISSVFYSAQRCDSMTINDDIAKIPRKNTHGLSRFKSITSVYINPDKMDAVKAISKERNVSISGILVFALDRLYPARMRQLSRRRRIRCNVNGKCSSRAVFCKPPQLALSLS